MEIRFCPGCAAILEQQPRTVGGVTSMYWVCPEGDWEEPVVNLQAEQSQEDPGATEA